MRSGAKQTDYPVEEELLKGEQESPAQKLEGKAAETENQSPSSIGGITFVQCATGATSKTTSSATTPVGTPDTTNGNDQLIVFLLLIFSISFGEFYFGFYGIYHLYTYTFIYS